MVGQAAAVAVENNFKKGLITEVTGLNFPESACTETYDCEFNYDGSVSRRLGFDFESNNALKNIDRTNKVVVTYRWRNVAGDGNTTLLVAQIGDTLYFYKTNGNSISEGAVADTVVLTSVTNAPVPDTVEAQFSDGNGLLFVTHPYCDPIRISYDVDTDTATAETITIQIRDFEGAVADILDIDERPTASLGTVNKNHLYNLYNQGWTTTNLTAWDTGRTDMPSNADVMWLFKNTADAFDVTTVPNVITGNTEAPKGHFIMELANQDRNAAAGTTDVASTTTGFQRPSTSAFFAGRVFYAGINYVGFNSKIYFSQIIERELQYGYCYQLNDPTSESTFDLLPSDGGVISIPAAGTVYKLIAIPGGLAVFAANGVWYITGSTGLGFTATDYVVQQISTIPTLSATSFVDVAGFPAYWNTDGIYIMSASGGLPGIQSLTYGTIKTFYDDIPLASKQTARGYYHNINGKIEWIYRSEATDDVTLIYEYDRILNFSTFNQAFYPWTVTESPVKINSIIVTDTLSAPVSIANVVVGADQVVDGSGNNVIVFQSSSNQGSPAHKYLVSYWDDDNSTYTFTFAEEINQDCIDWFQFNVQGVPYTSYFITGYKLRGEGLRKFQNNWVHLFSRQDNPVAYHFQSVWDYATTGSGTGKWGSRQYVAHSLNSFSNAMRRLKIRGRGTVLQFKVTSVDNNFFDFIGWSTMDLGNQLP